MRRLKYSRVTGMGTSKSFTGFVAYTTGTRENSLLAFVLACFLVIIIAGVFVLFVVQSNTADHQPQTDLQPAGQFVT